MSGLVRLLAEQGIAAPAPPFPDAFLEELNLAINDTLRSRSEESRAYVHCDELARMGMLLPILSGGMQELLTAILPDPVLYHCHIYEIAGNNAQPHIFGEKLAGWHRDPDSEFDGTTPTHISIFIYLSDVGPEDGAFEFCAHAPDKWLRSSAPAITVTGSRNFCFVWNRSYFHRASPNRGPRRRRLLKLSIQPNASLNQHMANERFTAVRDLLPSGDAYLDVLLGRYLGRTPPSLPRPTMEARPIAPTGTLGISDALIVKTLLRDKARAARRWLKGNPAEAVAYD